MSIVSVPDRRKPTNMRHRTNVGLMLGQRHRRWANIRAALVQRLMFSGLSFFLEARQRFNFFLCWAKVSCLLDCLSFRRQDNHSDRGIIPWLDESPCKHETSIQCLFNVGPPSTTLVQHWMNIVFTCCIFWEDSVPIPWWADHWRWQSFHLDPLKAFQQTGSILSHRVTMVTFTLQAIFPPYMTLSSLITFKPLN